MATVIHTAVRGENERRIPEQLLRLFSWQLNEELRRIAASVGRIEEIRLRSGKFASVTVDQKNIMLPVISESSELEKIVNEICGGSLYAYRDSLLGGYVTIPGGIRVGICGRASTDDRKLIGISDFTSLNFRLPKTVFRVGKPVVELLRRSACSVGILVYSPPGEGKTTLLRSVAAEMASGDNPIRVAVVDTRKELEFSLDRRDLCMDILSGYPKAEGIEIACRTMNAQLIVCDEISGVREAEAMISAQNCGVSFVASAHADRVNGLLHRTPIRLLHRARVFEYYVGIERIGAAGTDYRYTVTSWEDADALLQNSGSADGCL